MSLYRKYRPQTFADLTGQEHVRDTLQNQIKSGGISHAYLFTGPRGVGKTTTARLLAKASTCLQLKDAEPCNACVACEGITAGSALDVVEMDAATNTQVDKVRETIIDSARVAPNSLRRRVYIIDEVHMLSAASFNALLKTLEEPPAHALFILATTEIHKVPQTVISRCQRFDFRKIPAAVLVKRMQEICKKEKVKADVAVLEEIARKSEGCARDAESLLDQVIALADGPVTLETASLVLPVTNTALVDEFVASLLRRDAVAAITLVNTAADQGVELTPFADEVIERLRALIISSLKGESTPWNTQELTAAVEEFVQARRSMKLDHIPQLGLELAVAKLCVQKDFKQSGVGSIRTEKSEIRNPKSETNQKFETAKMQKTESVIESKDAALGTIPVVDLEDVKTKWPQVFEKIKSCSASLPFVFQSGEVSAVAGNEVEIKFGYQLHADTINQAKNRQMIEQAACDVIGKPVRIRATFSSVAQDEVLSGLLEEFGGEIV